VLFQKCSFGDSSQTESNIDNPFSQNVSDIDHNNISKTQSNPTMESQDMVVEVPAMLPSQNP
jgi:hypothetical protein